MPENNIPSPCYLMEEDCLRANLSLIRQLADETGVEFILAFKAFALWKSFPIFREYIRHTTASSPYEARLAAEEFGSQAHTYSPAYEEETFDTILRCSSHITFNSLTQFARFYPRVQAWNAGHTPISSGLRINPEYAEIETDLYNPCAPGSRFGVLAQDLPDDLPGKGIEGFHCHNHCESDAAALEHSLQHVEEKFGRWLPRLKWLNLGGGHLVTRKGYDLDRLKRVLLRLRENYPHLHIIMEPGSAFAWQTGALHARVVDIVRNNGIQTAILNVSFTCHMPDCLEMPYAPTVTGAVYVGETPKGIAPDDHVYRLGGNSCLSGDYMGAWRFDRPLEPGSPVVLEDMIHYTTVKTNMFNGVHHPVIGIRHTNGEIEIYRTFTYEDYRDRMC